MALIDKLHAFKGTSLKSRKVFIIGCGRSGTTWLGRIMQSHPYICTDIEQAYIFRMVTSLALDPEKKKKLFPSIIRYYRLKHFFVSPKYYCDKSHPNIWFAEKKCSL